MKINKEKIKVIVADVDMTIKYIFKDPPEINKQALIDLHNKGYILGLGSGRSVSQLLNLYKEFNLGFDLDFCIAVNGAAMYDNINKKEYKYLLLNPNTVKDLIEIMDDNKIPFHMYVDDTTIFSEAGEQYQMLKNEFKRSLRLAENRDEFLHGDLYKVLLTFENNEEREYIFSKLTPYVNEHNDEIKFVQTNPKCVEIVPTLATKAYGLNKFCELHNISLDDVVAFGDAENDLEMIEQAGVGVCLKDGQDIVKKAADYVTDIDCASGGFADFIYKNILN